MPFREMTRDQVWLLPPSLDELIPADHPARFVAEFVDTLDRDEWAELGVDLDGEAMGAPAYHPRALLSVWLYGFMTNVRSCRKLEAACRACGRAATPRRGRSRQATACTPRNDGAARPLSHGHLRYGDEPGRHVPWPLRHRAGFPR